MSRESINAEGVTSLLYEPPGVARQKPPFTSWRLDWMCRQRRPRPLCTAGKRRRVRKAPQVGRWWRAEAGAAALEGPERARAGDTSRPSRCVVTSELAGGARCRWVAELRCQAARASVVTREPADSLGTAAASTTVSIRPARSSRRRQPQPRRVRRTDAEFSRRHVPGAPIRAGATAELRLSSFALHGIACVRVIPSRTIASSGLPRRYPAGIFLQRRLPSRFAGEWEVCAARTLKNLILRGGAARNWASAPCQRSVGGLAASALR